MGVFVSPLLRCRCWAGVVKACRLLDGADSVPTTAKTVAAASIPDPPLAEKQ